LAHRSALNARAEGEQVILIDPLDFASPKTATIRDLIASVGAEGKVLFLTDGTKTNVHLSARNLPGVEVRAWGHESTYDLLWAGTVIIERAALDGAQAPVAAESETEVEAPVAEEVQDA
jgi:large subunit ribosomal protein L4